MIIFPVAAYAAAANRKNSIEMPKPLEPIFETDEEAKKSIIAEFGNNEYLITESERKCHELHIAWIKDNKMWNAFYQRKITGYRGENL